MVSLFDCFLIPFRIWIVQNYFYFDKMKIFLFTFFLSLSLFTHSQGNDLFYVFNADWKPTDMKNAKFFLHVQRKNDSTWQWDYYNMFGPLIKTERYKDKQATILNGAVAYYSANGYLDSTGMYKNGLKEGDFWKLEEDSLRWKIKYVYHNNELKEVDIEDNKQKKNDDEEAKFEVETESEYPGGIKAWQKFLIKNIRYPDRAINNKIEGAVRIAFIVDTEGKIEDSYVAKSVEFSLDEEALRIIRNSGKWEPAIEDNRKVKSYKIQPIYFRLE